ncbi:hypothetical protein TEA_013779 [Camellia sinensis var. sinensis]|uniref:50S ribosomal protein L35 n=1 Tax=Camellia sinensis var. sinensis TaxID=542762 RepID=A0A4S4E0P3_CAMSN|nr:hypothetical protein TEA_013779 [Camellia sinensis var. sinensis]
MQRWCTKLRSLAILHSTHKPTQLSVSSSSSPSPFSHRLLHSSPQFLHIPLSLSLISSNFKPLFNASSPSNHPSLLNQMVLSPPLPHLSFIQVRHLTKKEMKEKMKKFKPRTPVKSKLKKIKMKCYSSFKGRFRLMHDGNIRRWKEGKRHNAHLKYASANKPSRGHWWCHSQELSDNQVRVVLKEEDDEGLGFRTDNLPFIV